MDQLKSKEDYIEAGEKVPFYFNLEEQVVKWINFDEIPIHPVLAAEYTRDPNNVSDIVESMNKNDYVASRAITLARWIDNGKTYVSMNDGYTRCDARNEFRKKYGKTIEKFTFSIKDFNSFDDVINNMREMQGSSRTRNTFNIFRDGIFFHNLTGESSPSLIMSKIGTAKATTQKVKKVLIALANVRTEEDIKNGVAVCTKETLELMFEKHYRAFSNWNELTRPLQEKKITWDSMLKVIPGIRYDDRHWEIKQKSMAMGTSSSENKGEVKKNKVQELKDLLEEKEKENKELKKKIKSYENNFEQEVQKRVLERFTVNRHLVNIDVSNITEFKFVSTIFGYDENMTMTKEKMGEIMLTNGLDFEQAKALILKKHKGRVI